MILVKRTDPISLEILDDSAQKMQAIIREIVGMLVVS